MKKIGMLIVGLSLFVSPLLCQKDSTTQEAYSGTAIGTGGSVGGKINWFRLPGSAVTPVTRKLTS